MFKIYLEKLLILTISNKIYLVLENFFKLSLVKKKVTRTKWSEFKF